jgi:hypothetical protein
MISRTPCGMEEGRKDALLGREWQRCICGKLSRYRNIIPAIHYYYQAQAWLSVRVSSRSLAAAGW